MAEKIRMAQYGTRHGHAKGVLQVMLAHPDVEVVGVYEPDTERKEHLAGSGDATWSSVRWFDNPSEFLDDPGVVAVASEGANKESLGFTEEIVAAGKHAFYDKPAGDDYARFERVVEQARRKGLFLQMGYMFRNHDGFERIANWARSGFLGHVFQVRAHMSTWIPETNAENHVLGRDGVGHHRGGILYDLGGHVLDQIVWILGRPNRVTSFMQNAASESRDFMDNTLAVLEYAGALATVDIAAMETRPMARRFEVYGTEGSAIMEPFEPADKIRLCLDKAKDGYPAGVTWVDVEDRPRYVESFARFVKNLKGEAKPDRSQEHELLVQETLMRCTGGLAG
jgi:predicted dehydrogenase